MTSQAADLRESASGDERTEYAIGAKVSAAHFTSHVYYLVLPPLFPLLKGELHVGYVELALAITLFNILTLMLQAPMGFAVDRFDARSILVGGLCLGGFAYLLFAAVPTYPVLMVAFALAGINNFAGAGLQGSQGMSLETANIALTGYLLATAFGVLAGGFIADRTIHHNGVAALGFAASAVFVLLVAVFPLPGVAVIVLLSAAGFFSGIIQPSRDMMVREAVPAGAAGRVFGIVTTGFNVGAAIGPIVFGLMLDHGHPAWVFALTAAFIAVPALTASWSQWRRQRPRGLA